MKNSLPTLFKTVLATTSALTLVSSFATTAEATARISLNPTSTISVPNDWNPNGFNSGDSLIYGGDHTISASTINIDINVVDTAANIISNPFNIFSSNLQFGSIGSTGGGSGVPFKMISGGNGANIYLTTMAGGGGILPNDYSKFASLDFNGTIGSTILIQNSSAITLPTNFSSTGGDAGQIIISAGSSANFNGTFSNTVGNRVGNLVIETGAAGTFNSNLALSEYVDLRQGGTLTVGSNVTVDALGVTRFTDPFNTYGQVNFQGNATMNTSIASYSKRLTSVQLGAGEVVQNGNYFYAQDTSFINSTLKLNGAVADTPNSFMVISGNFKPVNDGQGKWKIAKDTILIDNLGSKFGETGLRFQNLNFENDSSFTLFVDTPHVQTITTSVDGQGSLFLWHNDPMSLNSNIGSPTNKIKIISAQPGDNESWDGTVQLTLKNGISVYANELAFYYNWDSSINYSGPSGVLFTPHSTDSSTYILEDNVFLDAPITTLKGTDFGGSYGILNSEVDVLSNATILQDIGTPSNKINDIKLLGLSGSKVNLSGDFHAERINLQQPDIVFADDIIFDGVTSSDSTTYSLGNRTLFFDNAGTSEIFGSPVVNFTVDDSKHGHFVVRGGTVNMNTGGMNSLILNLRDLAVILPPIGPIGQSYIVFGIVENTGQIVVVSDEKADFNILQQNPFVTWSYTNGVATRKRNSQEEIDQIITEIVSGIGGSQTALDNAILLADPNNTDDALSVFQNITSVIIANTDDLLLALNSLQPIIVEAAEQVSEALDQAISTIENRLRSLAIPAFTFAQGEEVGSGMAAGDEGYKNGAWASTYYGTVRQKARGEGAGFKSHTAGVMIGVDTMVTDEHTVGMSLSYSSNKVKHKDGNDGDTSKVKSYTMSIYGMQELNDKWFVQGVALFSRNAINNRERRFVPGGVEIARGDSM